MKNRITQDLETENNPQTAKNNIIHRYMLFLDDVIIKTNEQHIPAKLYKPRLLGFKDKIISPDSFSCIPNRNKPLENMFIQSDDASFMVLTTTIKFKTIQPTKKRTINFL